MGHWHVFQNMQNIIIFGASVGGRRGLYSLPGGRKAVAFCDNDTKKHGTRFEGLPVIAPAQLAQIPYDRILVASSYQRTILDQLKELGIPLERVDLLDPDILNGLEDSPTPGRWLLGVAALVVALALYGLVRLVVG